MIPTSDEAASPSRGPQGENRPVADGGRRGLSLDRETPKGKAVLGSVRSELMLEHDSRSMQRAGAQLPLPVLPSLPMGPSPEKVRGKPFSLPRCLPKTRDEFTDYTI